MKQKDHNKGCFITLEGGEGVGKSSNIAFIDAYLKDKLVQNNRQLCLTREPGGTPLAEEIRQLIVQPRKERVHENTELLLMFAARSQHLAEFILPELERGNWVLSDRFTDASFAYQGGGRGLSFDTIELLEKLVQKDLRPDLTFLLDMPVELGLARAQARNELDRIEQEELDFFERVRQVYLQRAQADPERFAVIDASESLEKVQENIALVLEKFLKDKSVC